MSTGVTGDLVIYPQNFALPLIEKAMYEKKCLKINSQAEEWVFQFGTIVSDVVKSVSATLARFISNLSILHLGT